MTLEVWYWLIMALWLLFGLWGEYEPGKPYSFRRAGWNFGAFILFALIGYKVFGSPVK